MISTDFAVHPVLFEKCVGAERAGTGDVVWGPRAALIGAERTNYLFARVTAYRCGATAISLSAWYGSPLDGIRSIAFLAKGLACSSVCRLSFGSDIHSRMIFRRVSCSGFMLKSFGPDSGRRQHKGRAVMRKDRCREVNAPAIGQVLADAIRSRDRNRPVAATISRPNFAAIRA